MTTIIRTIGSRSMIFFVFSLLFGVSLTLMNSVPSFQSYMPITKSETVRDEEIINTRFGSPPWLTGTSGTQKTESTHKSQNLDTRRIPVNVSLTYRRFDGKIDSSQCQSNVTIWSLDRPKERDVVQSFNFHKSCRCQCQKGILTPETVSRWKELGLKRGDAIFSRFVNITYEEMKVYRAAADSVGAKLVLCVCAEAPICRLPISVAACHLAHYHVSMRPDSLVRLSLVPVGMSPSWYSRPRYQDTVPRAVAFVGKPCYEEWKNYSNTNNDFDRRFGTVARGYWLFELQKHFPVDVYSVKCGIVLPSEASSSVPAGMPTGRNTLKFNPNNGLAIASKVAVSSRYRFVLALENKRDEGYVTEKFYEAFETRSLPIYSGDLYAYKIRPGNNSFLHVDDFVSAESLAKYLWHLVNNMDEYDEYFEWKKHPLRREFLLSLTESASIGSNLDEGYSGQLRGWLRLKESLTQDPGWEGYAIDGFVDEYISAMYDSAKHDPRVEFDLPELDPWLCRFCKKLASMVASEHDA